MLNVFLQKTNYDVEEKRSMTTFKGWHTTKKKELHIKDEKNMSGVEFS